MKKIAIFCDYGLDDAIATLYLLKYTEKFEKIDIIPIAGNFPLETTFINAKRILTHFETQPENVRLIDTSSIEQKTENIPHIHGNDGMGDILPAEYKEIVPVLDYDLWLQELDENYTLVSLGPCTVVADILKEKGSLPLILMGGNIAETPNYNGYEFNHGINPEAFTECVKHPHVIATLDTCHCDLCNLNKIDFAVDGLLAKTVDRYLELSRSRNESICSVYDLVTVIYLLCPERFETESREDNYGNKLYVLKYISDKAIFDPI